MHIRLPCHMPVHTKRIKKIALQAFFLMVIFLAILLGPFSLIASSIHGTLGVRELAPAFAM